MIEKDGERSRAPEGAPRTIPRARRVGDQLRGELLEAAARLAAGPRPVAIPSLRAVARACGVTAPAVYRHFPSQNALTRALLVTEYNAFERIVLADDDEADAPPERLRRLARAYVTWGLANPGMYQLLFESADQIDDECSLTGASDELARRLTGLLNAIAAQGGAPADAGHDPVVLEHLVVGLHGLVSLRIHKPTHPWVNDPDMVIESLLPL